MKSKVLLIAPLFVLLVAACERTMKRTEVRPNILFVISDDQSFGHTSFGGSSFIQTPAFDRIASEGVYFTNCYATSPGCAPARSAIVTGRYPWQNEQSGQHASEWLNKYISFIDRLAANGYRTGRTGKGVQPFYYSGKAEESHIRNEDAAGKAGNSARYQPGDPARPTEGVSKVDYFANFKNFIDQNDGNAPFFFWFGAYEPHRPYEKDAWKRTNKSPDSVTVPGYLPNNEVIRRDLLDYAVEIEWYDQHLQKMLGYLEKTGQLENTIVIVTSDNGMPFPRAKANAYEDGIHVPFAVRYPKSFPGGRVVEDFIGFIDLAPTILEVTGTSAGEMQPMTGRSLLDVLTSREEGQVDADRVYVLSGRERHSSSRHLNYGFPQRAIRKGRYLYTWNVHPRRWPAGAPQRYSQEDSTLLLGMHGLDSMGRYVAQSAYTDIDDCPSKAWLVENHQDPKVRPYFELAVGKRQEYELFDLEKDRYCLHNLAGMEQYNEIESELHTILMEELKRTKDPRVVGPKPGVFDTYKRYSKMRSFPKPAQ